MIRNLVAAVALAAANAAHAQPSYPSGPINLVIPLAAGDATDTAARAITEELSRELKVAIVPVNRPGAIKPAKYFQPATPGQRLSFKQSFDFLLRQA